MNDISFATNQIARPSETLNAADEWKLSRTGLIVPRQAVELPIAIDLFAGAGGFSCGFHQAGFHVIAALEFDFSAAITYMVNLASPGVQIHFDTDERRAKFEKELERTMFSNKQRGTGKSQQIPHANFVAGSGWISHYGEEPWDYPNEYLREINRPPLHPFGCEHFWIADARNVTGKQMLDALGLRKGAVTCVMGGPPCQGFSSLGKRDILDPRNSLVFEFARLVLEISPKTFVMENVPGIVNMRTPEGELVLEKFCSILEDGGYGDAAKLRESLLLSAGLQPGKASRGKKVENPDPENEFKPNRTSAALALMALEGRVRLGMGFVYFAPACKDSNYAPNLLPPSN